MPITTYSYNSNINRKPKPSFTAHPDFYKFNSTQSCYFRRGVVALPSPKYKDIEDIFCEVFDKNITAPQDMLIIGIGNSQEPFSYLASIKGIIKNRPLNKTVDLYTVDLQSKPDINSLKQAAFPDLRDYEKFPKYAKKGFIKDNLSRWRVNNGVGVNDGEVPDVMVDPIYQLLLLEKQKSHKVSMSDRVNDEIFNLVYDSYNNSQKSVWDSRIQDVIKEYPDNKFRIISANNILPYITSDDEIVETIKHINRTLKPNGYFITDPYEFPEFIKSSGALDNFTEVKEGIYQKTV